MFSEQFAIILLMAAAHAPAHPVDTSKVAMAPDARHAVIQAVKEPELVAALSLRAKHAGAYRRQIVTNQTMLASAD